VTLLNADLVEQSSAAAESLREQARQLPEAVSVFPCGDAGQETPARLAQQALARAAGTARPAHRTAPEAARRPEPAARSGWKAI
jgi:methyl-accepting chemotaxis protein